MLSKELLTGITAEDIQRILRIEHSDPHSVLGAHPTRIDGKDGLIFRFFHPEAISAELIIRDEIVSFKKNRYRRFFLDMAAKHVFTNGLSCSVYFQGWGFLDD